MGAPKKVTELRERQIEINQVICVGHVIKNAPSPNLKIPELYSVTDTRTTKTVIKNRNRSDEEIIDVEIAPAPILIQRKFQDIENFSEAWEITWKRGEHWRSEIVDRDVAQDSRKLVSLSRVGVPVNSSNAKGIVEYLLAFESSNMDHLPISYVSGHLGWQGDNGNLGYLTGADWIPKKDATTVTFRGADDGDEQLARGFHSSGDIDLWIKALQPAMSYDKPRLAFYVGFVPLMLDILKCGNFIVDFSGKTSTGKTTILRIASSVAGCPDDRQPDSALFSWDATGVGLERMAAVVNALPLCIDETQRAKNEKIISDFIYGLSNGRGKTRGSKLGLAETGSWRTVAITSGEVPITSFSRNGAGKNARVLVVRGKPFGDESVETRRLVEQLNVQVATNFGHGVSLFARWLIRHRDQWDEFAKSYRKAISDYADAAPDGVAARLGAFAAAIEVTGGLVHVAFSEMGHDLLWDYKNPLNSLWSGICLEASDALGEREALRDTHSWIVSNAASFYGRHKKDFEDKPIPPSGGWFGRWDSDHEWKFVSVDPQRLRKFLSDAGYRPEEIFGAWRERGWIECNPKEKTFQVQVRIEGSNPRQIKIKRTALENDE